MPLTEDEVHHIATLCRIFFSPEEVDGMKGELSHILEQFQVLMEMDTQNVTPTSHSADLQTVTRADEAASGLDKEQVLANAPQREGDFFKVKVVLEE